MCVCVCVCVCEIIDKYILKIITLTSFGTEIKIYVIVKYPVLVNLCMYVCLCVCLSALLCMCVCFCVGKRFFVRICMRICMYLSVCCVRSSVYLA